MLDYLPHGYPFDTRPMHMKTSIAQALGKNHFILLELVPKKGIFLQPALAAILMSLSTVIVAFNAILLRRQKI